MKKIILFLVVLLFNQAFGFDYNSFCSTNVPKKTLGGETLSALGINSINRKIVQKELTKAVNKEINQKSKVRIDTFFGTNILNGEFSYLNIQARSANYKNYSLSDLNIETFCPYNKVDYKDKELFFLEPMVLKYSLKITQNDLDSMINSSNYKKILENVNNDKVLSSLIKVNNPRVEIKDDKLAFKYEITPLPFVSKKPFDVAFKANLKVEDNKLALCDFDLNSIKANYDKFLPFINLLNPMNYNIKINKNTKAELKVENVRIKDSIINLDGFVLVPKSI